MKINQIIDTVFKNNSIYHEIMDNIIGNKKNIKSELISELALSFLSSPKKIEDVWEKGYFKYYFLNAVTNQIHSNTSPLYKITHLRENIQPENLTHDAYDHIEDKVRLEERYELIENALQNIEVSWFDMEIFSEYYSKNKSYRMIENEFGVDHVNCWVSVKKTKNKIKKWISDNHGKI